MDEKNTVYVQVAIDWTQTRQAMLALLNSLRPLPDWITDKQLAEIIAECETARQRLAETTRGG